MKQRVRQKRIAEMARRRARSKSPKWNFVDLGVASSKTVWQWSFCIPRVPIAAGGFIEYVT